MFLQKGEGRDQDTAGAIHVCRKARIPFVPDDDDVPALNFQGGTLNRTRKGAPVEPESEPADAAPLLDDGMGNEGSAS